MTSVTLSVILTTIGRPDELRPLLESLVRAASTGLSFEFVMTDQSDNLDNIRFIAAQDHAFPVRTTTSQRGASAGRNAGLAIAQGAYYCFPDDTSWYADGALSAAVRRMADDHSLSGLSGILLTPDGRPSMLRWQTEAAPVSKWNWYRTSIEPTLFVRADVIERVGGFDETMGTGSSQGYGSGEGTDLILRIIEQSGPVAFDPDVVIYHPEPRDDLPANFTSKMAAYGAGFGRLYADHPLPKTQLGWLLGRKAAAAAVHRVTGKKALAQSDWAFLTGAVAGYRRRHR